MSNFYNREKYNWYDRKANPPPRTVATCSRVKWEPPEGTEPIKEFPNYYIDREGHIYNSNGKELASSLDTKGYLKIALYKDNQRYTRRVHVLVALQFLPIPDDIEAHPIVDHIDADRTHCSVDNLQWVSQATNIRKSYEQGRIQSTSVPVRCIEDDKIFFSISQASEFYNISKITVKDAIEKREGYVKRIDKHFEYAKQ